MAKPKNMSLGPQGAGAFAFGAFVNEKQAKVRFGQQMHAAKTRGISWDLTFEQWLEWWGSDLEKRGSCPESLQMCRKGDVGSYSLGNIYKGTRDENFKTGHKTRGNKASVRKKCKHEAYLDSLMWAPSRIEEGRDFNFTDEQMELLHFSGALPHGIYDHLRNFDR